MTATTTRVRSMLAEEEWTARECDAAAPFLADLLERAPHDDDALNVRHNAVAFAEQRAELLARQYPTEAPGRAARQLLAALRDVRRQMPKAAPEPKTPPQSITAAARFASELAQDPALVEHLPIALTEVHDRVLGGPGRPLAEYLSEVDAARERLAQACEERLSRIPADWRRHAGAPTRDERAQLAALRAETGMDLQ